MAKKTIVKITRIDAVYRQLSTAISLYFQEADPVAVHTLACAALGILRPLNKARGKGPMLFDVDLLPPEAQTKSKQRAFWDDINRECNFFKHGSSNPQEEIDFRPDHTEQLLMDGVKKYFELSDDTFPLGLCFLFYSALLSPDIFNRAFVAKVRKVTGIKDVSETSRKDFAQRYAHLFNGPKPEKVIYL